MVVEVASSKVVATCLVDTTTWVVDTWVVPSWVVASWATSLVVTFPSYEFDTRLVDLVAFTMVDTTPFWNLALELLD